jgi:NADPH2:quinone reductase
MGQNAGMRSIVVEQHGGPEVLTAADRETPPPGPDQILVDVTAAGVNFMDIYQRTGAPPYKGALPYVPGTEGAGTVTAVGPDVTDLAVGDRVAWTGVPGCYAEQVLLPAASAVPVPDDVDLRVAAAVMLQGLTAHYLSNSTFPVAEGDLVVVHAAAGGVGLLLTQMVKLRGGIVVATTSTQEKAALAEAAGADYLTGYAAFGDVVREVSNGTGAAAVFDGVGAATFDESLKALRRRGLMILYGAASGPVPPFELQRLAAGGSLFITRPTSVHYMASRAELVGRTNDLFNWIRQGKLDVRIGGTYPLDEAARAHDDLAGRRTTGKLLLLPR